MELRCKKCNKKFEFDEDKSCECNSIENDKQHTRYECDCAGECPNCKNCFDISYEYWIDNYSDELLNGYENFNSIYVEMVQ